MPAPAQPLRPLSPPLPDAQSYLTFEGSARSRPRRADRLVPVLLGSLDAADSRRYMYTRLYRGHPIMHRTGVLLALFCAVVGSARSASADSLLWSHTYALGGGSGGSYQAKMAVGMCLYDGSAQEPWWAWSNRLFDASQHWLTASDDGVSRTIASAADDPQF